MSERGLLIDDDTAIYDLLRDPIAEMGFELVHRGDGNDGLRLVCSESFQFVLLDLCLPGLGGTEICRQIREQSNVPIIMLTSSVEELNKVLLLELGADDYVTKPFSVAELKARIRAVLRRALNREDAPCEKLVFGDLQIDIAQRQVILKGESVKLTAREFDLVVLLASNPGKVFDRDELNSDFYGDSVSGYDRSITNHLSRIRKKLEENPNDPRFFKTVHGVGYCFVAQKDSKPPK